MEENRCSRCHNQERERELFQENKNENWEENDQNNRCEWMNDNQRQCSEEERGQRHVHEVLGSVMIAEREEDPHNHRFATVSGEAILVDNGRNHVHEIEFRTDFYEDHFHTFRGRSGEAVNVGGGRHVHFVAEAETSVVDGHRHEFRVASLIQDPIGE